ncbi:hypothetical protein BD310DRAFT_776202, partial [Dichomitus squalens]
MHTRTYAMRQNSYFRPDEWNFLLAAVLDQEVQEYLDKGSYTKARALLSARFQEHFTSPSAGETEEAFKQRLRFAKKGRKGDIVRIRAESQEEWDARMQQLNNQLKSWLYNYRAKCRRAGVKRWVAPPVPPIRRHRKRALKAFDMFCKSDTAPKGADFVTNKGQRFDLSRLQAARKAAWDHLSDEDKEVFQRAVAETLREADVLPELVEIEGSNAPVAYAEDIAAHVDDFFEGLHEDVKWGGFAMFGGPDHDGEARIHFTHAGTNRNGQSFMDALLQWLGLTQLEFETVFSLWVEQSRQGPQANDEHVFAESARRAIEHCRAQAAATHTGNTSLE